MSTVPPTIGETCLVRLTKQDGIGTSKVLSEAIPISALDAESQTICAVPQEAGEWLGIAGHTTDSPSGTAVTKATVSFVLVPASHLMSPTASAEAPAVTFPAPGVTLEKLKLAYREGAPLEQTAPMSEGSDVATALMQRQIAALQPPLLQPPAIYPKGLADAFRQEQHFPQPTHTGTQFRVPGAQTYQAWQANKESDSSSDESQPGHMGPSDIFQAMQAMQSGYGLGQQPTSGQGLQTSRSKQSMMGAPGLVVPSSWNSPNTSAGQVGQAQSSSQPIFPGPGGPPPSFLSNPHPSYAFNQAPSNAPWPQGIGVEGLRMGPTAPESGPMGPRNPQQLMEYLLFQEFQKQMKKKKKKKKKKEGKSRGSSSSSSDAEGDNREIGLVRSLRDMHKLRRMRVKQPLRICRRFRRRVLEKLNVRAGQIWSYRDHWGRLPVGRHRTIGRIMFVLAEILERFEMGEGEVAWASTVQLYKSLHQFLIDGGDWRVAWDLTLLEDPFGADAFGGSDSELAIIGGHLKATSDLSDKVHGRPTPAEAPSGQGEADPEAPGARGRGRGKRR